MDRFLYVPFRCKIVSLNPAVSETSAAMTYVVKSSDCIAPGEARLVLTEICQKTSFCDVPFFPNHVWMQSDESVLIVGFKIRFTPN